MERSRGVLFLTDSPRADVSARGEAHPCAILERCAGEDSLSRAQEALWRLRRHCEWICVAASGGAVGTALALAAQLPVDRVALSNSRLFDSKRRGDLPRSAARLERFARRNLALVASEILLVNAEDGEIARFLRCLSHRRVCVLETGAPAEAPWRGCEGLLCAPWDRVNENNLLLPGKCV